MIDTAETFASTSMTFLSRLLLAPRDLKASARESAELTREIQSLDRPQFEDLLALAGSNHVLVRGMEAFLTLARDAGDRARIRWAESALAAERARIRTAVGFLHEICNAFKEHSYELVVIKSLDHWPDIGSDLDLFTQIPPERISNLMRRRFDACIAERSWGDRLAAKWNFMIPGLPEPIEVHFSRLGQTGEQESVASNLLRRARTVFIANHSFRVPSISDRLMISSLQRMYRHFYFRLCDVIDSAALADAGAIDYESLRAAAESACIWDGVATYLVIVSDYVKRYRGTGLDLPTFVRSSARFGGDQIYFARDFLRVPIMPQSARLYGRQLADVLGKGELHNGARLSLLPWLATAAAVRQKLTGSDKGIW
ncbi:MAG TPA: hypothetical protein VKR52_15940 [Terracidiphilus sp.]|nr:hypothetical protein [Terracidiphilus sp.]